MIASMVAHFAGMKNAPLDHLPPELKGLASHMQEQYDMEHHAQEEAEHAGEVTDDFVKWFSICGPAAECEASLRQLIDLGLDHVYILGGSPVPHPHGERQAAMVAQARHFAEQVLPKFR